MKDFPGRIPFDVSFGVFLLTNFIGNSIVCAVILRNKFMRTPVNYLLFNLAIADIMVGVFTLAGPYFLGPYLFTNPGGTLGDWLCKTISGQHSALVATALLASTLTLSAVAYERFQAVVHPFTVKKKVTTRKVFLFVALSWTVAFSSNTFVLLANHFDNSAKACRITPSLRRGFSMYFTFLFSFMFGISFVTMSVFYSRVICELKRKQNQILKREQLAENQVSKRITFMLITVTVIFGTTWGTGSAIGISLPTYYVKGQNFRHYIWVLLLVINSSVNCFLYTLFSSQFRKGVKSMFRICRKIHRIEIGSTANRHDAAKTGENSRSIEQSNSKVIETKL